ncbi:MAG: Hsp70 family protein [Planctomycetaceae bacterium]|jgi:molecular chaperone DnaK (HSP70)|nr:Hsp70 family protein [Planctomycetaceae bacterium]
MLGKTILENIAKLFTASTAPQGVVIYGIDLGTTYSAVAYMDENGNAQIIPNSENDRITPSVVYFDEDDNVIVGKVAKESAKLDSARSIDFIKRQMSSNWTYTVDGHSYSPEEISAFILKRLAEDAAKTGNHKVQNVVITVPAYFGDKERARTRTAGELAGLNVIEILDEPVAAALNYSINADVKGKNVLVYDLGGGTFDVTVVNFGKNPDKNEISIICTEGNHRLGGKDWDDRIINYYLLQFHLQTGSDMSVPVDPDVMTELRQNAETDKKVLSAKNSVKRKITIEGKKSIVELTREKFEELTADLLNQTLILTDKVIRQAGEKGYPKLDTLILVGGSSRMPQIKEAIAVKFHLTPGQNLIDFDVDEAVAKGAARAGEIKLLSYLVQDKAKKPLNELPPEEQKKIVSQVAGITGKSEKDIYALPDLKKVATKSYGIKVSKSGTEIIRNLIVKQTPVPAAGKEDFVTSKANSRKLNLTVYINDESVPDIALESGEQLGSIVFPLDGTLPAGSPVEVTFTLDEEGALCLTGFDKTKGSKIEAVFHSSGIMTEQEKDAAKVNLSQKNVE